MRDAGFEPGTTASVVSSLRNIFKGPKEAYLSVLTNNLRAVREHSSVLKKLIYVSKTVYSSVLKKLIYVSKTIYLSVPTIETCFNCFGTRSSDA